MDVSLLGAIAWWKQMLLVVFIVVCVLLIILVLLQKGRGGGLAAAFGGAGGQSAFGSKTGDVFTWVTIVAAGVFLLLAVAASYFWVPEDPDEATGPVIRSGPPAGAVTPTLPEPRMEERIPVPMIEAPGTATGTLGGLQGGEGPK